MNLNEEDLNKAADISEEELKEGRIIDMSVYTFTDLPITDEARIKRLSPELPRVICPCGWAGHIHPEIRFCPECNKELPTWKSARE